MNKFYFFRNYLLFLSIINLYNPSVFGEEKNCLNYPYPDGIYFKNKWVLPAYLLVPGSEW